MNVLPFPRPISDVPIQDKPRLPVSQKSKYEAMLWDFSTEIQQPGMQYSAKCIKWNFKLDNGKKFDDPEYAALMESAKDFIYSLKADPIEGRLSNSYGSLIGNFKHLRHLLHWMIANNYERFSQLDEGSLERYEQYHKNRKAKNRGDKEGGLKPRALVHILNIVRSLYLQRGKIADAITVVPFDGETASERVGVTLSEAVKNKTKRIPDEVAVDLLGKAFQYIEVKSEAILKAQYAIEEIKQEQPGKSRKHYTYKLQPILKNYGFDTLHNLNSEKLLLSTACYIIIAYFSGMRISEGMSIKAGCIEKKRSDNGTAYYLLHSTYYKTVQRPKGDTWLVPEAVATAVDVLERLSKPLREKSGLNYLFLCNRMRKNNEIGVISNMNTYLKQFMQETRVVLHQGKPWNLTPHQFRKSFAYFMARENKCNLKFLQGQFKHVSMDMTMWYVITEEEDAELLDYVASAVKEVSFGHVKDFHILGKTLGGGCGAYTAERRDVIFQGKTVDEINDILLKEGLDDLYVRAMPLGLCVFNERYADCYGSGGPCNPNTCKNAVVTDEHKKHWDGLLQKVLALISQASSPLQKLYAEKQLNEFVLPMFKQMKWELEGLLGNREVAA